MDAQSYLVHKLQHFLSASLQAVQPDPKEADHAEGAGQRSDLGGHRRQTPGRTLTKTLLLLSTTCIPALMLPKCL